jgi:RNA polymerase sigma factor (sigma-70 family)
MAADPKVENCHAAEWPAASYQNEQPSPWESAMSAPEAPALARIRRWLADAQPGPDAELLRRFAAARDEGAFAALVDRHGPMVLGVARRITGDHHAAEDVFQAAFLMLARRAGQLRRPTALAAWLHRTAFRLSLTSVRARTRRERAESTAPARPSGDPLADLSARELLAALDEELHRLPETLQLPLVHCCLEGRSQEEAALLLGCSPGAVRGRLERGRRRLRDRLARRGLTFAAGAGAPFLVAVPTAIAKALRESVLAAAFGRTSASPAVSALAEAALRSAPAVRWCVLAVALVGLAGIGAVAAVLSQVPPAPEAAAPPRADAAPSASRADTLPLPAGALARLGWDPLRVGNSRAALTPDGKKVVTLSAGAVVHVFDAATGKLLERRPLGDRRDIFPETWYYSLSADGSTAAVVENTPSGRFTVWDVATGRRLLRLGHVNVHSLSADGRSLAAVVQDDQHGWMLRVYDLGTGKPRDFVPGAALTHLWFTPDGKRLLGAARSGGDPDALVCFDVPGAKQSWVVRPGASASAVRPDGRTVFLAKPDTKEPIRALDVETGNPAEGLKLPGYEVAGEPAAVGDRLLLVPLKSGEVGVWDYRAGKELRRVRATAKSFLSVRAFAAADGKTVLTDSDGVSVSAATDVKTALTDADGLRRWDLATGEMIFGPAGEPAHFGYVNALAFLPDGELLSAGAGGELRTWDVATGGPVGERGRATSSGLSVTRVGVRMVKVEWARRLTVVDAAGKQVGRVALPDDFTDLTSANFWRYALLGDGRTAVTYLPQKGAAKPKALVAVADYVAGKILSKVEIELPDHFDYFQGFSPCGRWLAAAGKIFAVSSGQPVWSPSAGEGWSVWQQSPVRFSADGRLMCGRVSVTASAKKEDFERGEHDVWEVASGQRVARFTAKHVERVVFGPDNRTLAYVTGYGVHLIDLETGKPLAEYEDPGINCSNYLSGEAPTLAFSPDGRAVATGHHDGSILVWKVPQPATAKLTEAERAPAWNDLAGDDVTKARRALDRLARDPAAAAAVLGEKFKATGPPADVDIPALIRDLDNPAFAVRERATRRLREVGPTAEPSLKEALKAAPPEMKGRIEQVLEALAAARRLPLTGEALRGVRAIEILERTATPEARTLLRAWAEQPVEPRLAAEARLALDRLELKDGARSERSK